jgi:polysaccharide deacetylase 2 family uncharacterized protein YibQ
MTQRTGPLWPVLFFCSALFWQGQALGRQSSPVISIIIDDMGKTMEDGRRVLRLPGPVACAFLPRAPHTGELATEAHGRGKEVMLHLPMDSVDGRRLDAGAVTLNMTHKEFARVVEANLAAVPYVQGINNHMGSLLTRHPGHMLWLMEELQRHPRMFFVDSRTTVATVARRILNTSLTVCCGWRENTAVRWLSGTPIRKPWRYWKGACRLCAERGYVCCPSRN